MTQKLSTLAKAAIAITMLTSSVAFAQDRASGRASSGSSERISTQSGSFIPADGVVGAGGGVGGGSAVSSGVGAGLSTGVIIGGIVAAVVIAAIVSDNSSSNTPSGTTGTR